MSDQQLFGWTFYINIIEQNLESDEIQIKSQVNKQLFNQVLIEHLHGYV